MDNCSQVVGFLLLSAIRRWLTTEEGCAAKQFHVRVQVVCHFFSEEKDG